MRVVCCVTCLLLVTGCGSETTENAESSANIPLSIPNPTKAPVEDKELSKPQDTVRSQTVTQLIAKARAAVQSGRNLVAIEALSQAIGIEPNSSELLRMRAEVYVLTGENANARADFSTAIHVNPQSAELHNSRGYFLMRLGLSDDAAQDFEKAIELKPEFAEAWNNRGLVKLASQQFEEAKKDFAKAVEVQSDYADAWNNRGFASFKMQDYPAALKDLNQSLKLNPKYLTAWNNLGLVQLAQEDYESAVTSFGKTVELAPLDVRWYNHRRVALQKLERFDEAAKDQQKINWLTGLDKLTRQLAAQANDPAAWIARADYLAGGSQFGAAIQDYSRALALDPSSSDALTGRAQAWVRTGDLQKAISDCDESLVIERSREAFSVRGDIWLAMENYDQAVQDYESAQRFDSQLVEAYQKRGEQRLAAGQKELAEADLAKAKHITQALAGELPKNPQTSSKPEPLPENL